MSLTRMELNRINKNIDKLNTLVLSELTVEDSNVKKRVEFIEIYDKLIEDYKVSNDVEKLIYCQERKVALEVEIKELKKYNEINRDFIKNSLVIYVVDSKEEYVASRDTLLMYGYKSASEDKKLLSICNRDVIYLLSQDELGKIPERIMQRAYSVLLCISRSSSFEDYRDVIKEENQIFNNYVKLTNAVNDVNKLATFHITVIISVLTSNKRLINNNDNGLLFSLTSLSNYYDKDYSISLMYLPEYELTHFKEVVKYE